MYRVVTLVRIGIENKLTCLKVMSYMNKKWHVIYNCNANVSLFGLVWRMNTFILYSVLFSHFPWRHVKTNKVWRNSRSKKKSYYTWHSSSLARIFRLSLRLGRILSNSMKRSKSGMALVSEEMFDITPALHTGPQKL